MGRLGIHIVVATLSYLFSYQCKRGLEPWDFSRLMDRCFHGSSSFLSLVENNFNQAICTGATTPIIVQL